MVSLPRRIPLMDVWALYRNRFGRVITWKFMNREKMKVIPALAR